MSQYCYDMVNLLFQNNVESHIDVKIHAGHCRKCGYLLQNVENIVFQNSFLSLSECVHPHEPLEVTPNIDKKAQHAFCDHMFMA